MECFDVQVNGYGGVDFNSDDLSAEQLHLACERLAGDGVSGFLATVITDHEQVMCARLTRLAELRERDPLARRMIAGIHVEGPFVSRVNGYRGAHPADAARAGDADLMRRLLDAGGGLVRLVTLAPEADEGLQVTRLLRRRGITVSAGHTDASRDQLTAAIDAGLSMFTHLGNGCPMQMHRHDNIIQRVLSLRERLWITFIADGVHVPFFALQNYLNLCGDRAVVVTDAMAAAGLGPGVHRLGRWEVSVGEDLAAWAPDRSHLLGSAMIMQRAVANLQRMGLSSERIVMLVNDNPRKALGFPH